MANKNDCIDEAQHLLITQTYRPSKYIEKTIKEGSKQKERKISIPKFYPDQIIQWAVLLQTIPYFTKGMYVFTCGSVPNRGTSYAKRYLERWLHNDFKGTRYCLKLDVHHFYQSVNHNCLKEMLKHKFKDGKLLKLFCQIIDSTEEGLPIGNVTSQWFANFYLQGLDHYIKEKLHAKYYVRYMDDMVILGSNKRKLGKMKAAIEEYLNNIGLELNSKWQKFKTDSRGIDFLGYRFFHNKTILRRSIMLRISRKVRKVYKKKSYNKHNCMSIISYLGWIKHSDSYKFYQKWIKPYANIKRMKGVIRRENFKYSYAKQSV
ncbi:MAG: RNA-directed DNA polymerase [Clostridia bacterium]|nr:RNA-directed DNA polymerase [Clostridia bacterium]